MKNVPIFQRNHKHFKNFVMRWPLYNCPKLDERVTDNRLSNQSVYPRPEGCSSLGRGIMGRSHVTTTESDSYSHSGTFSLSLGFVFLSEAIYRHR